MFWKRLLSSIVLIAILVLILWMSQGPTSWLVPLVLTLLSIQGIREFSSMAERKECIPQKETLFVSTALYFFGLYLLRDAGVSAQTSFDSVFLFILLCFVFVIEGYKKQRGAHSLSVLKSFATTLTAFIYIPWCLGFTMKILYFLENGRGLFFLIFLFLVSKSTDIFAYLIGKKYGKHKLAEKISPKKTIEGSLGGLVGATVLALISQQTYLPELTFFQALIFGCTLSLVSQVGDLSESLLKRDTDHKDSGSCLFGLGGILDLLDSILLAAPLLYFLMSFFCF
jgi:phosphatidate cytidylyltransferase